MHAEAMTFHKGSLKCYYDEIRMFSFATVLKYITSTLYEKQNAVYYFPIPLFFPEIFKFLKYAN